MKIEFFFLLNFNKINIYLIIRNNYDDDIKRRGSGQGFWSHCHCQRIFNWKKRQKKKWSVTRSSFVKRSLENRQRIRKEKNGLQYIRLHARLRHSLSKHCKFFPIICGRVLRWKHKSIDGGVCTLLLSIRRSNLYTNSCNYDFQNGTQECNDDWIRSNFNF